MTHIGNVTQQLKSIPPERLWKKVGRSAVGLLLLAAGLRLGPAIKASGALYADKIVTALIIAGAVLVSFEFLVAPINYFLAALKDLAGVWRRFKNGKNGNGTA